MSEWVWMPHPGHFICARDCKFFMNTKVGEVIVSTVGEYLPSEVVREIFAESRGVNLRGKGEEREADYMKKIGFEQIGYNRKYETMVFKAKPREEDEEEDGCCPWVVGDWSELDSQGYNKSADAYKGHMEMCKKWENKKLDPED